MHLIPELLLSSADFTAKCCNKVINWATIEKEASPNVNMNRLPSEVPLTVTVAFV